MDESLLKELAPGVIRTAVTALVGALVVWGARVGLGLDAGAITVLVTPLVTAAYWGLGRWVEQHVSPMLGSVLLSLGFTRKVPTYR